MNTDTNVNAQSQKSPDRLEHEIDRQRDRISGIIDALEYQMAPRQLLDRAVGLSQDNGREFADNLRETVQAHPVPALLSTVGLAWMFISRNEKSTRLRVPTGLSGTSSNASDGNAMDNLKDGAKDLGDKLSDAKDQVRGSLEDARAHLSDSTSRAADTMRDQGRWARDRFNDTLEQNPMALGAVGVALGALVGALLPRTEQEDRLMGSASDRATSELKDQAQSAVHEARDKVASSTAADDSRAKPKDPANPG